MRDSIGGIMMTVATAVQTLPGGSQLSRQR